MAKATIQSGTTNLLNTIVGAGILAMPFGLKSNGIVFGSLLILWSAFMSAFGLYLQNKVAKYTQQTGAVSYFSLAQLTYPHLSILFDSAISIKCFGVGVSYLVVIGDLMPKIMQTLGKTHYLLMERNFWITLFMLVIVTPLSYLKKISSLRYTSLISLFTIVYLICLVADHYWFSDIPVDEKVIDYIGPKSFSQTLSSFPIFVFAYTCHQNMFAIINELKPNDEDGSPTRQSNCIIRNSISIAACSYLIVGLFGYLTFGNQVNGNIITMYPSNFLSSLIGQLCIVLMVSLSFPLQCHPCRSSVNHVIYFLTSGSKAKFRTSTDRQAYTSLESDLESVNSTVSTPNPDGSFVSTTPVEGAQDSDGHDPIIVPLTTKKFYFITTGIVVASYLVAITVKSLARVLALVGSTGSTSISFILPGLFGFLLIKPINGATSLNNLEKVCKYGGLVLAIYGVIVMVVCLTATIFLGAKH